MTCFPLKRCLSFIEFWRELLAALESSYFSLSCHGDFPLLFSLFLVRNIHKFTTQMSHSLLFEFSYSWGISEKLIFAFQIHQGGWSRSIIQGASCCLRTTATLCGRYYTPASASPYLSHGVYTHARLLFRDKTVTGSQTPWSIQHQTNRQLNAVSGVWNGPSKGTVTILKFG